MPLIISDEELQQAGLDGCKDRIEQACRLFDIGTLALRPAVTLAGSTSHAPSEGGTQVRNNPIYRPTVEELEQIQATPRRLRGRSDGEATGGADS